jgi:hypothetical protein
MLSKLRQWGIENDYQITWFIIGSFTAWFLVDLGRGDYVGAAIDAFVVAVNVAFRPRA